jgi:hypothetical protein
MAVHTVPQDVETDDKILGPFNLRQFIYLLIAAAFCGIGYVLFRIFVPLVIIVIPPVAILLVLALPLKKDQPMETYLAAKISFIFKNNKRIWTPGQSESTIEIIAPKKEESDHSKGLSRAEVSKRLSFLADIVDTEGYAIKNSSPNLPFNQEVYAEAESITDMYDADRNQTLNQNLADNNVQNREALVSQVQQAITNNTPMQPVVGTVQPQNNFFEQAPVEQAPNLPEMPDYYATAQPHHIAQGAPTDIFGDSNATATEPEAEAQAEQEQSVPTANPSMVELAHSDDLSVQAIAKEANRISEKQEQATQSVQNQDNGEVYISLH